MEGIPSNTPKSAEKAPELPFDPERLQEFLDELEAEQHNKPQKESTSVPASPAERESRPESELARERLFAEVEASFKRLEQAAQRIPAADSTYKAEVASRTGQAVEKYVKKSNGLKKLFLLAVAIGSIGGGLIQSEKYATAFAQENLTIERVLETREADAETERMMHMMVEDLNLNEQDEAAVRSKLWYLAEEVGWPKIRWTDEAPRQHGRAFYDANTRTVYVDRGEEFTDTLAEFAHAKQHTDNFDDFYARAVRDHATYGYSYSQYHTPGTIEYEAHQEIEPELRARFPEVEFPQK